MQCKSLPQMFRKSFFVFFQYYLHLVSVVHHNLVFLVSGITAEAIVVSSFDELQKRANEVFFSILYFDFNFFWQVLRGNQGRILFCDVLIFKKILQVSNLTLRCYFIWYSSKTKRHWIWSFDWHSNNFLECTDMIDVDIHEWHHVSNFAQKGVK